MDTCIPEDIKDLIVRLPSLDDNAFGHWVAGFIDGEGCFSIIKRKRNDGYDSGYWCRFSLQVRDDDEAVIQEIIDRTGIGTKIYRSSYKGHNAAIWEINTKPQCLELVLFLNKYPLRAKKARDFYLWEKAVLKWIEIKPVYSKTQGGQFTKRTPVDWSEIARLKQQLHEVKNYRSWEN